MYHIWGKLIEKYIDCVTALMFCISSINLECRNEILKNTICDINREGKTMQNYGVILGRFALIMNTTKNI